MTDASELDPGIRDAVLTLQAHGFKTTDSGDGKTKPARGDEQAEREPHVYMVTAPEKLVAEAHRLYMVLLEQQFVSRPEGGAVIEAAYNPIDGVAILAVHWRRS